MVICLGWEGDYPITQKFGARPEFYNPLGLAGHEGIDIGCPAFTRVRSLYDGVVGRSGFNDPSYGNFTTLRLDDGREFWYCHLEPYDLHRPGEWVAAGAPMGWTGRSGRSDGYHLHIGYRPRWWEKVGPFQGFADPYPQLGIDPPF